MVPSLARPARRALVLIASVALLATTPALAASAPSPASGSGGQVTAATSSSGQLVDIRAARHTGFDRVVLQFDGRTAPRATVTSVSTLLGDFSGEKVPIPGRGILRVQVFGAAAHDDEGMSTINTERTFALPNVLAVRGAGDFEGVLTLGIGLAKRTSFHVHRYTNPGRIVIDVSNKFAKTWRKVYFVDSSPRLAAPVVRSVMRQIPNATPVTGLLDRVFAGPSDEEMERGLRIAMNGATGFRSVGVSNGVARLRLTGGCRREGTRTTIASSILPTLRQLRQVDYIKIYDPKGRTTYPTGRRDSLPSCLKLTGRCLYLVSGLQRVDDFYLGEFLVLHKATNGRVVGGGGAFYSEGYLVRGRITTSVATLEITDGMGPWVPFPVVWIPARNTFRGWTPITYAKMRLYSGGYVPGVGEPCG